VCLQHDPVVEPGDSGLYEVEQLAAQLTEMDEQLRAIAGQIAATEEAVSDREGLVESLSAKVEGRTSERVTPRLQAFNDAVGRLASARSNITHFEGVLRQWDRVDDLAGVVNQLNLARVQLKRELAESERSLAERRDAIISELNEEFQNAIALLGVPGVEEAAIHPSSYLPLLNRQRFDEVSLGGGIITATQIAYWTTLLTVALRRGDTYYPSFLIIDSPRLALNNAETLSAALYRRMVAQADIGRGSLQLIVADNEIPPTYRRDYAEIKFTYDRPTVYTVRHPGPAAVKTITADAMDQDLS
jgi:hypothetical protein